METNHLSTQPVNPKMKRSDLKEHLEYFYERYNQPGFIQDDPISIPHSFSKLQDVEIMGFFAAVLAWGQRVTTINKCKELSERMDHAPHDFMLHHEPKDLKRMVGFKHRTFNDTDLLYFIAFFRSFYEQNDSLEDAFLVDGQSADMHAMLSRFQDNFFGIGEYPIRTRKHVASPQRKSSCKRLNMYLRWMVRRDDRGVDLGIWSRIGTDRLMCPLDVHVERSARKLGLLKRKQRDWQAVEELTANLRKLDPTDPVRYDFALFGMGLEASGRKP